MRWDSLRAASDNRGAALFDGSDLVVRTVDTPEFRDMTFYEVYARSVINKVPAASRMPFRWTINPYRGCSHACRYCLAPDTPILMADGRERPLRDVRVGDAVYGTLVDRGHRRFVLTRVLAHWSTSKLAYRLTLKDGTGLVASGDHRFLTDRGWVYVAGPPDRPSLGTDDTLVGTGGRLPRMGEPAVGGHGGLAVTAVEATGQTTSMVDITTGTGDFVANGVVSHNCFARSTHTYLDMDTGRDFDSRVVVKVNTPQRARAELAAPSWRGEHIAMGTNVDCYQRAEGRYRLMPGVIEALRDRRNPFSILTKATLILRDLPLLAEAAAVTDVAANVSVGFLDSTLWRGVEPGTPRPASRLSVCQELNEAGVRCGVLMAPILPFLTDTERQLDATVRAIAEAGATHVTPIVLHLRPGAREWYLDWLREAHPDLLPRYRQLYRGGSYADRRYQSEIGDRVRTLAERYGVGANSPADSRRITPPEAATRVPRTEQPTLM